MTPSFSAAAGAVRRTSRIARRWSASIALLAFQVAPVGVTQTAEGKLDLSIGVSADQYLQQSFGCDGTKLAERGVESKAFSAIADFLPRSDWRISAFLGTADATTEACSAPDNLDCYFAPPFGGAFGGATVSKEAKSVAVGLGLAALPARVYDGESAVQIGSSHTLRPTLHLRVGDREKKYLRFDLNTVRSAGQVPMSTLGLGFGRTGYRTERGFVGVGVLPYEDVGEDFAGVITGNVAIPIKNAGDMLIGGYFGAGNAKGLSVGARLHVRGGK